MNFTKHEIKIYNNTELALYQSVELEILMCELTEIRSLQTLFYNKETPAKMNSKQIKYKKYETKLLNKINNCKRLLKNTNLRLNNNINKCMNKDKI